jgi:hypothetical protein
VRRSALVAAATLWLILAPAAGARPVPVSIDDSHPGREVEDGFLGLSLEAADLPAVARGGSQGNLVPLLRSLGPGVLRFGGASVDLRTAYADHPPWANAVIEPADFDHLRTLLSRTGWRAIVTVPLGHFDPQAAAREVVAASRRLGPLLLAVEIGNEPDGLWIFGLRPPSWGYGDYSAQVNSYRRAIRAVAPAVPIAGPDTVGYGWLRPYARDQRPAILTAHYYPLNVCAAPAPSIATLLSDDVLTRQGYALRGLGRLGRSFGLVTRLGETNNIGCAGETGVSDTYAAALWALRYMATAMRAGISGINFHTLIDNCRGYSPICMPTKYDVEGGWMRPMPEWYALLLFSRLTGDRAVEASPAGNPSGLTVNAFAGPSRLDVLVVNTGEQSRSLVLRPNGNFRSSAVLRLSAPALNASSGVELGGRPISGGGGWRPPSRPQAATRTAHGFRMAVPAVGAALVTLYR